MSDLSDFVIENVLTKYNGTDETVVIPEGVTVIGSGAFFECKSLVSVTIPDSVRTIDDLAFAECTSLSKVSIPESVTKIGDFAFARCKSLTEVSIPDSVTSMGISVFFLCPCDTTVYDGDTSLSVIDKVSHGETVTNKDFVYDNDDISLEVIDEDDMDFDMDFDMDLDFSNVDFSNNFIGGYDYIFEDFPNID